MNDRKQAQEQQCDPQDTLFAYRDPEAPGYFDHGGGTKVYGKEAEKALEEQQRIARWCAKYGWTIWAGFAAVILAMFGLAWFRAS